MSAPYIEVSISISLFERYEEIHRKLNECCSDDKESIDENARLVCESIQIRRDVFTEAYADYVNRPTLELVE